MLENVLSTQFLTAVREAPEVTCLGDPHDSPPVNVPAGPSSGAEPRASAVDSELGLVDACRRGRVDGFERLFHLHGGRMKSIALNLLGNTADAEDAVQEAFLKIHRGIGSFAGQSAFSTWIYRILVNACYDMRRRSLRRIPTVDTDPETDEMPHPPAPAADHPLRMTLERSVAQLNQNLRSVFLLYEVEGFQHSEIAAMLGISEGASKNRLFEAKRELRRLLSAAPRAGKETGHAN